MAERKHQKKLNMSEKAIIGGIIIIVSLTSTIIMLLIFKRQQQVTALQENLLLTRPVIVCEDPLCIQKANILRKYSSLSTDPCQDFYEYSCSRFNPEKVTKEEGESREDWTPRERLGKWALLQMHRMLEDKNIVIRNQSKSFDLATQYYKACLMKFSDTKSGSEKNPAFQKVMSLFQGIVQDWTPENNLEYALGFLAIYDIDAVIKVKEIYSQSLKKYIISLDAGELTYEGSYKHVRHRFEHEKDIFMQHLRKASILVNDSLGREIWELEYSLFKISYNYSSSSFYENNSGYFNVSEVQKMLRNSVNLSNLIGDIFNKPIKESQIVFVKNVNYLEHLHKVLARFSRRHLFNLVKWYFVRASSRFLSSDFSEYLPFINTDASLASRDCLPSTMDIFEYATGILYSRERRLTSEDKQLIKEIFGGLKETFEQLVNSRAWLVKSELKRKVVNKIQSLKYDLVEDDDLELANLDEYYNELSITRNQLKNFFGGMIMMKNKKKLLNWLVNPVDTQVALNPETNVLQIPLGLLQSPVFQSVYPISVLYGTLGSILGRQLSYSLNEFELADFRDENNCYSGSYKEGRVFNVKYFEEEMVKNEIEADHLSVRLAYSAYKNWQSMDKANETRLTFGELSTSQTFFLSYAQAWCRTLQPNDWMDLNPNYDFQHPSKMRINNVLKNIPEFSEEFKCPVGSPMNPAEKCLLW